MTERKTSDAQMRAVQKYKQKLKRAYIEFYPAEEDLFEHLQNQPKKQSYLKDLIRADMMKEEA